MGLIWLLALAGACSESVVWSCGREAGAAAWWEAPWEWRRWLRDAGAGDGDGDGGAGDGDGDGGGGFGRFGYGGGGGDFGGADGLGDGFGDDGDGSGDGFGLNGYHFGSGYSGSVCEDVAGICLPDGTELVGDVRAGARSLLAAEIARVCG